MTIAYFTIIVAFLIPIICAAYAKFSGKNYNNRSPRDFVPGLEGRAKRAYAAQMNGYETFPPYAAGVLAAHQMHASQQLLDFIAVLYILTRIGYVIFYVEDKHVWRSATWFLGLVITISLFLIGTR